MKNPIGICRWCEELFERENGHQKYCSEKCRNAARRDRNKKFVADHRKQPIVKSSLDDTLRELAQYNAEHGTYMSYGQYQMMKYKNRK